MKQLVHSFLDGRIQVLEVPPPLCRRGMVLVRNHYSVISPGTESRTVRSARAGLIRKAREKPDEAREVIGHLREKGPVHTYRAVMEKLTSYAPLGYSSAGEVIGVASDVRGFSLGDQVACGGGGYANHAEIATVPVNLCVKLPPGAHLTWAAYNTMGAIAMQGVRQADLRIGESCAVIGLGLIGQLACLILRAGGIRVVGIDIDPKMVEIASKHCTDWTFRRDETGLVEMIHADTQGIGADAVIITAATKSLDPINLAGRIARQRGRIVVVGEVPMGFSREPYYRKELELKMSCSYGPGRYDGNYEEKGIDYPVGYVRWTENRNMLAFQELVYAGRIRMDYLTTHTVKLDEAPAAYDMILKREEPFLGVVIAYNVERPVVGERVQLGTTRRRKRDGPTDASIGFLGAGSYARSYLLPNIPRDPRIVLAGVMTASGTSSRTVADKHGFGFCTSDERDILNNPDINTVFIATRHDTHGEYVIKALKAQKGVFVEKPLCIREEELDAISTLYTSHTAETGASLLMVGFNRRFSALSRILKERVGEGPMAVLYRINAGPLSGDSWIHDPDIGGGRVLGEICHFVDFLTFLNGSTPDRVCAFGMPNSGAPEDTVTVSLRFKNGSIGTISYVSNGSAALFKEYVEVHRSGLTAILSDFKELILLADRRRFRKRLLGQDKGQRRMVQAFLDSVRNGGPSPIPFGDILATTRTTFRILESLRTKAAVGVEEF